MQSPWVVYGKGLLTPTDVARTRRTSSLSSGSSDGVSVDSQDRYTPCVRACVALC